MTVSTIAPEAHAFSAAEWLEQFTHVGGGYTITDAGVYIGWINPAFTDTDNRAAKNMICALSPAQHKAIENHLIAQQYGGSVSPIVAAWDRIKSARVAYNAAPIEDDEAERFHWATIGPAESEVRTAEAKTRREVEIKLWVALAHCTDYGQDDADVHAENLATLIEREATFDFAARVMITAIRDLRNMEA